MNRRILIGIFSREQDVLNAIRTFRQRGLSIVDVYIPYAIHGLDRALGWRPTRLPWVCFLLGLLGAPFKVWFEYWTTAFNWPINVGGKPWDSLPAFVPVTFEVMVLCAGVSTVIAFFIASRLWPGRKTTLLYPEITNDKFAIVLEETDSTFDPCLIKRLCEELNAVHVEERLEALSRH